MGKPFKVELSELDKTYEWAMRQDVTPLSNFLRASLNDPVCFVGSGGSFSAATFAAYLHEQFTPQVAEAMTPLQFSARSELQSGGVLMMSAAGRNRDILSAFKHAIDSDTSHLAIACLDPGSTLTNLSRRIWVAESFSCRIPTGPDGFLATNSLLAFFVLTARSYHNAGLITSLLPGRAASLRKAAVWSEEKLANAVARQNVIILFGPHTRAAAVDLESKLSEAALASPQLVDFRNFAHGRHHWIAKHADDTGLVAFVSPDVKVLAYKTLGAVGKRIPIATVDLPDSPIYANIAALFAVFEATRIAGDLRGIDPGRPGVPEFGRRIYNLRPPSTARTMIGGNPTARLVARRKFGAATIQSLSLGCSVGKAAQLFAKSLCRPTYGAVLFDFDGTLCSNRERFSALSDDVASALEYLLRRNIKIGIATGRGKSVRRQVQQSLNSSLWEKVWIGYYNGCEVAQLADDAFPKVDIALNSSVAKLDKRLRADVLIAEFAEITTRPFQITLESKIPTVSSKELWRYASRIIQEADDMRVLFSMHSVDIVPNTVSKLSVLKQLRLLIPKGHEILCIGDLGQYPGNDFDLLTHEYSLSSDQLSPDLYSCWNLAPASFRGVQATLYYLRRMKVSCGEFRLELPQLR